MAAVSIDVMERIAQANVLGRRYFEIVSDNYRSYIHFIVDCVKNPEKVAVILGAVEGANFLRDVSEIIYPEQHENKIIESFKLMIFNIFNNFSKRYPNNRIDEDEALSYGQEALRRAIWGYTDTKFQFSTYAYHAISSGVKDLWKIEFRRFKKNKEFTNTINNFDEENPDSSFGNQDELYSFRQYQSVKNKPEDGHTITSLSVEACKNDFEKEMLFVWLNSKKNKQEWVPECREAYRRHYQKDITEAGIREKWRRLKSRIVDLAKSKNIRDIDISPE